MAVVDQNVVAGPIVAPPDKHTRIVLAALKVFAAKGFAASSTREIAKEAGVAEGTIFRYFESKVALLRAVPDLHANFATQFEHQMSASHETATADLFPVIAMGFVHHLRSGNPDLSAFNILINEGRFHPELHALFREAVDLMTGVLAMYLRARVDAGELRSDADVDTAAELIFSAFLRTNLTTPQSSAVHQTDITASVQKLANQITFILRPLLAQPI